MQMSLDVVIVGAGPVGLLIAERRPVAEAVIENTRAQAAIMRPDPQSGAMREIVAKLMQFDNVNRFFGEMISGVSVRYDLGSESDGVGRIVGNKLVGQGQDKVALYDLMQDGMGVLLDASAEGQASKLVEATTERIRCLTVDEGPSMLIRPDACVAWVGEGNGTAGLEYALHRWFTLRD